MTGPIDESRHSTTYVGEGGTQTYNPKPWQELTPQEKHTIEELKAIERWQSRQYATQERPRMGRRRAGS